MGGHDEVTRNGAEIVHNVTRDGVEILQGEPWIVEIILTLKGALKSALNKGPVG